MTEPTPTAWDILQDARLDAHEQIFTPSYTPPESQEHSFPVVGQGISSQQFQQMSLAQGSGVLITDGADSPYWLRQLPGGAAETNARNQMVLTVAANIGRAEAIISGFYHVLYQDMIIDLPPVTTATSYWICLTYDPRREEEPSGPVRVEVHTNDIPRTHGRKHIILHEVYRTPNTLLTDAGIEMYRHYISPTITAGGHWALPDPADVNFGSLGVSRNRSSGGTVIPGTGQIFESRGNLGWHNLLVGQWQNIPTWFGGWTPVFGVYRRTLLGVDVAVRANRSGAQNPSRPFALPNTLLSENFYTIVHSTSTSPDRIEISASSGQVNIAGASGSSGGWINYSFSIPDWYLAH